MSMYDIDWIETPNKNDVLSGRGNSYNHHAGNVSFRDLVANYKVECVTCTKQYQKRRIANSIYDEIKSFDPPGRFLKKDSKTKKWKEIGKQKAIAKIRQALRENAREIEACITGDIYIEASTDLPISPHNDMPPLASMSPIVPSTIQSSPIMVPSSSSILHIKAEKPLRKESPYLSSSTTATDHTGGVQLRDEISKLGSAKADILMNMMETDFSSPPNISSGMENIFSIPKEKPVLPSCKRTKTSTDDNLDQSLEMTSFVAPQQMKQIPSFSDTLSFISINTNAGTKKKPFQSSCERPKSLNNSNGEISLDMMHLFQSQLKKRPNAASFSENFRVSSFSTNFGLMKITEMMRTFREDEQSMILSEVVDLAFNDSDMNMSFFD